MAEIETAEGKNRAEWKKVKGNVRSICLLFISCHDGMLYIYVMLQMVAMMQIAGASALFAVGLEM